MPATNTFAKFKYNLAGRTSGILYKRIIANSAVISIGEFVKLSGGYIATAGANSFVLGVVVGIVDKDGIDLNNSRLTLAGTSASWAASTNTFTAGSNNTSTDLVAAIVDIDPFSVWSLEPDSTIGTTTGSNLPGYYADLPSTSDNVDEDTTTTSIMQLFLWGVDPEDSTRCLVSIAEHQIWGTAD